MTACQNYLLAKDTNGYCAQCAPGSPLGDACSDDLICSFPDSPYEGSCY